MPKDRSADRHATARHIISVEAELWDEFGTVVGARNRSAVIRDLLAAFLGKPGAKMPRRSKISGNSSGTNQSEQH